jgi:putative heme-binding domain-containing protein
MSDAFPPEYQNRIFMANIHEHALLTDILEPSGSGFIGRHGDDFLLANNAQWVGFSVEIGPAGDVYVLDWHDADICGSDVLNKDTGRIFRITSPPTPPENWTGRYSHLNELSDIDLVELQMSPSAWHARRARVILQHRAHAAKTKQRQFQVKRVKKRLIEILAEEQDVDHRLRAMWTLHVTELFSSEELLALLDDDHPYLRGWAIQLLCEDLSPSQEALLRFAAMAPSESSPVTRLYLAAALQRLEHRQRWPILNALSQFAVDADDPNIPKMLWFALEPMVGESPRMAMELAKSTSIPLLTRQTARRLVDANLTDFLLSSIEPGSQSSAELLAGWLDAIGGRYNATAPNGWHEFYATIKRSGGESAGLADQLSRRFGDASAAREMLARLEDPGFDTISKRDAIRHLAGQRHPAMKDHLLKLLDERELRVDAIRAMANYDLDRFSRELLKRYSTLSTEEKLEAVQTMASRSRSGRQLTSAIRDGQVPRGDIPAYVARVLRRVVGASFVDVWGPIDGVTVDKEALFAKYRGLLMAESLESANPNRGRLVFKKTCAACHKLYDEGGLVGPDITGANRSNLDYLLGNILTPSVEIQDAYKMQIILTDEGRIYSGIPAEENQRQLKLRIANQEQPVTIAKSAIESRQIASVSMMPDGLLNELTAEEVRDLFAYLSSTQPLDDVEDH